MNGPPHGELHGAIERLGALVALALALAPALSQSAIDRHVGRSRGYTAKLLAGEYEDVGSLVLQRYARFFGVPAGFAVIVAVSLLTRAPGAAQLQLVQTIRYPARG